MPVVSQTFSNITVSNDPATSVSNGFVDLSMLLSEYYGKQIRQGHSFKLVGYSATLMPSNNDDFDSGMSVIAKHQYVPTTKHSRNAWNMVFNQWNKQKKLNGHLVHSKYEDFELGFDSGSSSHDATRTSTIMTGGIGTENPEKVMLSGASTSGSDVTLADYYNSTRKTAYASVNQFTGASLKQPKYEVNSMFPEIQRFYATGTTSVVVTDDDAGNLYSGAIAMNDIAMLPVPLDVLCGLLKVNVYIPVDDTVTQWADTGDLIMTYYVKSWSPLVKRAKKIRRKSSRNTMRRFRGRRKTRRFNRR